MPNRLPTAIAAGLVLAGATWLSARGAGPLPSVGPLLDPVHGAWAAARFAELPARATANIPRLTAPVDIRYDRRGVPHIFAATDEDAIRALGFVVARDRFFQLDLQTKAAAGRLTEWAGARVLPMDRETRSIGMPRAVERAFAGLDSTSPTRHLLDAYADGVNAWLDGASPDEWPVEYRILNARPERWRPINSLHLFARMGLTLTYFDEERTRLEAQARVGRVAANALYASHTPIQEPIQPNGQKEPRFDVAPLPPPGEGDDEARLLANVLPRGFGEPDEPQHFASNNWAVAPQRSATHHALLAGDPHLELTLPSIWYEAHLVVPGKLDVYGVTIPGAPGIIIGFNRDVAWSFTNTGADVMDFYREQLDSAANPTRYLLDSAWMPLEVRAETYRGKDGEVLAVDTLRFTHRGPIVRWDSSAVSLRWTVLEPGDETRAFLDASKARTTREFLDAMARSYSAPAQNMIVADRQGSIAIRSTGRYPVRPDDGDGLTVRDGRSSKSDWIGNWRVEKYPQSFDPRQGFLASANQEPIDPRVDSTYLGFDRSYEPWRALQINRLLRADSSVTADEMREFQTNPGSYRADLFAPLLVAGARAAVTRTASLDSAAALLAGWDRRYTREQDASVLFELAMRMVSRATWDELHVGGGRSFGDPSAAVLLRLMRQPESAWWDVRATDDQVERRDDVIARGLAAAYDSLTHLYGPRASGAWRWSRRGTARIAHALRLPGFGADSISVQGGPGTLNPSTGGGYGSSWRMVVELGPTVSAFGTYPGGQSGNPASSRYLDRLPFWREGQLDTLFAPASAEALPPERSRAVLRLLPRVRR